MFADEGRAVKTGWSRDAPTATEALFLLLKKTLNFQNLDVSALWWEQPGQNKRSLISLTAPSWMPSADVWTPA